MAPVETSAAVCKSAAKTLICQTLTNAEIRARVQGRGGCGVSKGEDNLAFVNGNSDHSPGFQERSPMFTIQSAMRSELHQYLVKAYRFL